MASVTQPAGAPAAGKGKGKKTKGQKLDIDQFLDSSNFKMVDSSWADMMEDEEVMLPAISLPSAPKSVHGPEIDFDLIPPNGPFRAQVANLQYEVTEDQLSDLFKGLSLKNLRIVSENGRQNGQASVEFETKQDLIDALSLSNRQLNGRSVRIFLPGSGGYGGDRYGDRDGRRGGPRGGSYVDNTPMNWRSAERTAPSRGDVPSKVFPPPTAGYDRMDGSRGFGGSRRYGDGEGGYRQPRNDYGGYGGRRDYGDGDRRRDGDDFGRRDGGRRDRYGDEGRGNWGRGAPRGGADSAEPEADNWRSARTEAPPPSDREGGYARRDNGRYGPPRDRDIDSQPPPARDSYGPRGGDSYGDRRRDDGYAGGNRDREFERAPRDETYDRRSGGDDYEPPRSFAPAPPRDRAMSGRSDRSNPDAHDVPQAAPKDDEPPRRSRPPEIRPAMFAKLLAGDDEVENKPSSYSSIFGSAKPVDTLKRELEIEKKLAEEKAAAEEKEAAAKEAAAAAGVVATSPAGSVSGESTRAPPRDRVPRGDGAAPPRMNRRENGEHRGERGPRRHYDDRNGMGGGRDGPRRDGDRRSRMGADGAGNRSGGGMGRRRDDGPRGDGYGGDRSYGGGERRYAGRDDRDGPRRYDDGPSGRYYRGVGGGGSGGREYDRDYERTRYISDGDQEVKHNYVSSNKYQFLHEAEDHGSD